MLACAAGAAATPFLPRLVVAKGADGAIRLTAREAEQSLVDGAPPSTLWTYDGTAPGPTIRAAKGERLRVHFVNELSEPTSIHWHGIRIANAMDGVSGLTQDAVEPGETFEYDFIVPDAGTYWYHAHNRSWNQVARGLYGPLIVDGDTDDFDAEHDLTLVVDDWLLEGEGTLETESLGSLMDWSHGGRLGNWLTVNGRSVPEVELNAGEAYRIRLINAANARIFEIDPNRFGARVIAYDGQPLPEPVSLSYRPMLLGPAQRADLLMEPEANGELLIEELSGDPFAFVRFKVSGQKQPRPRAPAMVSNAIPEPDLPAARTVRLVLQGGAMGGRVDMIYNGKRLEGEDIRRSRQVWAFNGIANLAEAPFFSADRGETIFLETDNQTAFAHAMHLHGHHFRVLGRSGSDVDEGRPWRDTFMVGPEQTTRIAFVADNPGKWLLHCHMLEHAAGGMNTWFAVT